MRGISDTTDEELPYGDERSRVYSAAGGSKKNSMLLFVPHPTNPRPASADRFFPFADIRLMEASKDGRQILIEFSHFSVLVRGRNLRAVANGIGAHGCSRLEAFDADHRDRPTDESRPFIETIAYLEDKKPGPETAKPETEKAAKH